MLNASVHSTASSPASTAPDEEVKPRRRLGSALVLSIAVSALLSSTSNASAAGTYSTTAPSVNVRSCASTACGMTATFARGTSRHIYCQVHGQLLRRDDTGYSSDVWNKVAEGWTSDLYWSTPTTGAFSPGMTDCGSAVSAPASREAKAYAWAQTQVGRTRDDHGRPVAGWCARWAVGAYGRTAAGYYTAHDMWNAFRSMGLTRTGRAPVGTLVFFAPASVNGQAGHVAVATDDGRMITTPARDGQAVSVQDLSYAGATYLGYAYPPASWSR